MTKFGAAASVAAWTRPVWHDFGEISPLGQTFKNLRQIFESVFCVWRNFKPTLAIFINLGQIWAAVSSQIMKNNLAIWSHWEQDKCLSMFFLCKKSFGSALIVLWGRVWPQETWANKACRPPPITSTKVVTWLRSARLTHDWKVVGSKPTDDV